MQSWLRLLLRESASAGFGTYDERIQTQTNRCAELEKLSRELTEAYDRLLTTQTEVDFMQSKITKHLTVCPFASTHAVLRKNFSSER